jgi:hypothetical protein
MSQEPTIQLVGKRDENGVMRRIRPEPRSESLFHPDDPEGHKAATAVTGLNLLMDGKGETPDLMTMINLGLHSFDMDTAFENSRSFINPETGAQNSFTVFTNELGQSYLMRKSVDAQNKPTYSVVSLGKESESLKDVPADNKMRALGMAVLMADNRDFLQKGKAFDFSYSADLLSSGKLTNEHGVIKSEQPKAPHDSAASMAAISRIMYPNR